MNDFVSVTSLKAAQGYIWERDEGESGWQSPGLKVWYPTADVDEEVVAERVSSDTSSGTLWLGLISAILFAGIALAELFSGRLFWVIPAISVSLLSVVVSGTVRRRLVG